jgi:hypothetical protein
MNRLAGIIVAAIGFVVAILSITKVVSGLTQPGIFMILLGGLIIGLSFIEKPLTDGAERMSTPSTLGNMFFSPTDVFRNLRQHPRWLVAALIMAILSATYTNLFMTRLTPERVTNHIIDKTMEMPMMNDEARRQIEAGRADAIAEAKNPVSRAGQAISGFATSVFWYAFLAFVFMLFAMAMGGSIYYWQAFSAVVYAYFPYNVLKFVLNTLILYLKDPSEIHPLLGQQTLIHDNLNFLVLPAENPILYTLLGAISLLGIYWLWLIATGLKNAGERVTGSTAWTASIGIYVLIVLFSVTMAALFPGFIS